MITLESRNVELAIDPWLGGGMLAFKWRGIDVFRPHTIGTSPLGLASFPLTPFCNRIAHGHIDCAGHGTMLPIAPDGVEPAHALHGVGWTSPWATDDFSAESANLSLQHDGTLWPWSIKTQQRFDILENGYSHTLSVTNRDQHPMPAGLGLHPYFPRADAALALEAKGFWKTGPDRLPQEYRLLDCAPEWFEHAGFDNCFAECTAPIIIDWPTHRLKMQPSANLCFAHVYTPPGEDFFCVEPVSHIPDAVNSDLDKAATGLVMLDPGETMEVACRFELEELT
ncbi:MAG: hypothetical protein AAGK02_14005 [Pseudomonadota bacterium]